MAKSVARRTIAAHFADLAGNAIDPPFGSVAPDVFIAKEKLKDHNDDKQKQRYRCPGQCSHRHAIGVVHSESVPPANMMGQRQFIYTCPHISVLRFAVSGSVRGDARRHHGGGFQFKGPFCHWT
jgi:hypothetical protein